MVENAYFNEGLTLGAKFQHHLGGKISRQQMDIVSMRGTERDRGRKRRNGETVRGKQRGREKNNKKKK